MTTQSIEIVEYDVSWPDQFEKERELIQKLLSPWLTGAIEHIGSTAVPGLAAKPVIDIMAPVKTLSSSLGAIPCLAIASYAYYPYKAEVMHWFCKPSPRIRTHHLHLVPLNSRL